MSRLGQHRLDIYAEKVLAGDPAVVAPAGAGLFVQEGYVEDKTLTRFATATIPFDATIPQITEGQEVLRLAYTPLSMANILWLESFCFMGSGTVGRTMLFNCFFEDATPSAFATGLNFTDAGTQDPTNVPCFFRGAASLIGAGPVLDISVRIGENVVAALNFNGQENSVLVLGATKTSFLRILERAP